MSEAAERSWAEAEAAREAGRFGEAGTAYRKTIALVPDFMPAHVNSALALEAGGRADAAIGETRRALHLAPDHPQLPFNLGNLLNATRRPGALAAFRCALALDPAMSRAWLNLGVVMHREGALSEAAAAALRILAIVPDHADAWNNLGNARRDQGRIEDALAGYERALALRPGFADAARNHLCAGLYRDDDEALAGEKARRFARRFGPPAQAAGSRARPAPAIDADPERALRIGLLSSDLGDHPVGCNLAALFEHRDRRRLWLAAYDTAARADPASAWFRAQADLWRNVAPLSDRQIAEQIRADRIDILVSLAGHFDLNRPLVAAWRPAPVQAVMHDGGPSGLNEDEADPRIDAWITDRWLHPDGEHAGDEDAAREPAACAGGDRLLRLPLFYNFLKPARPPSSSRPDPAGTVFGSFSNPAKLSRAALATWARILQRLPQARLVLKYRACYGDPGVIARVQALIRAAGGDPERLVFAAALETGHAHLERYGAIDIALDPFPFSGATTSFEALAMGVPVLTLAGKAAIGRTTTAILGPLGLDELIARTPDDYVERAVALAHDPERLARLRSEIPERLAASPLIDGKAYAASLEAAFHRLWRERGERGSTRERAASVLR